jgi:hypothetical protein
MPGGYTIDVRRGIVFSRAWGQLSGDDVLLHARALGADPGFVPQYRQLFDMRAVTRTNVSDSAIWTLADDSPFRAGARRAMVMASTVAYGLARMFETLRDGRGEAFLLTRDIGEAVRWLDLDDAHEEVLAELARVPDMMPVWARARTPIDRR